MAFRLRVLVQANSAEEVGAEKQQLRSSPPSSGCPPSGGSLCIHFFTQHILSRPLTLVHPLHSTWLADPISSETPVFFCYKCTIFKVFIEFLQYCFCFMFWCFAPTYVGS